MKKLILLSLLLFVSFLSSSFATSQLDQSISWMNQNGLTKFTNAQDFMATNGLRRDEASKFFVQYATEILGRTPDTTKNNCNFTDLGKARTDLQDLIKKSCQLGLFQGSNGKFMPTQSLTNAQAITVLIRMIDGTKDETQGHFAQKYFEKAQQLSIMNGLTLNSTANFDRLTTRGEVGILLFNASNLGTGNNSTGTIDITTTNKISDQGSKITQEIYLTEGLHKFNLFYIGDSNFIVKLLNSNGDYIDLLSNEIGNTDLSIGVQITKAGNYLFNVTADGNREITTNYETSRVILTKSKITGQGTNIIGPLNLLQGLNKFKLTHDGDSNFIVKLLNSNGDYIDLLSNEIGVVDNLSLGVQILKSGDYYLNIKADGNRTIEEF